MNVMILFIHIVHLIVQIPMAVLTVHVHQVLPSTKRQKPVKKSIVCYVILFFLKFYLSLNRFISFI
jgi:hypothetical protein